MPSWMRDQSLRVNVGGPSAHACGAFERASRKRSTRAKRERHGSDTLLPLSRPSLQKSTASAYPWGSFRNQANRYAVQMQDASSDESSVYVLHLLSLCKHRFAWHSRARMACRVSLFLNRTAAAVTYLPWLFWDTNICMHAVFGNIIPALQAG